jgi:acetoacetyl-CoA reductase/3-oxoacyl-[acyl-carrier protein] reductase
VNNAGVQQRVCALSDLSDLEWHRVLSVNLGGAFYLQPRCRPADAATGKRRHYQPVLDQRPFTSRTGRRLQPAKAGVISLTKTLAIE